MSKPDDQQKDYKGGLLKSLLQDASANTIAISAAAMVPLLAMVGGAVDASRYYMTEARLQAACDAGALAARRSMTTTQFTTENKTIGENFFDQNFESGMFGIEKQSRTYAGQSDGSVKGTATGALPTSLMGVFGYNDFEVSVECAADINISNTDIVFVVDVTGSMNCNPDNPGGGNCGNSEDSNAKIKGLRNAVMTFYDTVAASTSSKAQVRYGMVPYASNVNVGKAIAAKNASWMANDAVFQSRWAEFEEVPGDTEQVGVNVIDIDNPRSEYFVGRIEEVVTGRGRRNCENREPDDYDGDIQTSLGTHQGANSERIEGNLRYTNYNDDNETVRRGEGFYEWTRNSGGSSRRCVYGWDVYEYRADIEFEIVEEFSVTTDFKRWVYSEIDTASPPGSGNPADAPPGWEAVDIRDVYDSTRTLQVPVGDDGEMTTLTWDGCIEEAETVATTTWDPIPTGALDMNINLVPSNEAERWKPVINNIAWERRNGSNSATTSDVTSDERSSQSRPSYNCPKEAFRLTDISRSDLQTYVNDLTPRSNTYHDLGMLWGARFVSPNGIFKDENEAAPNGDAIARHIVFMTDGILAANREVYGTYGIERWSRRVSGDGESNTTSNAHAARFQAACRLARQENISVWVVAFGTDLSSNLSDCATPGRAFKADDSDELKERFRQIAQEIAALRLTQ